MSTALVSKKGYTLLEVSMATVILGVMTVSGSVYFSHAARARMDARGKQAALIEANSLMERTFEACNSTLYTTVRSEVGKAGYFSRDMVYSSSKPSSTWVFDGDSTLPISVTMVPEPGLQTLSISVAVDTSRGSDVTLTAIRCCE